MTPSTSTTSPTSQPSAARRLRGDSMVQSKESRPPPCSGSSRTSMRTVTTSRPSDSVRSSGASVTAPTRRTSLRWVVVRSVVAAVTSAPFEEFPGCVVAARVWWRRTGRWIVARVWTASVGAELGDAVVGVGLPFVVDRGDGLEPAQRVVAAARREERLGVGVPEASSPRLQPVAVECGALEADDGGVVLLAVAAGAGDDDGQLDAGVGLELGDVGVLGERDRAVGPAESALAVGEDRQVCRVAGHPADGAELGEGGGVVAGAVCGEASGLADECEARREGACVSGVLVGAGGVVVEEEAR